MGYVKYPEYYPSAESDKMKKYLSNSENWKNILQEKQSEKIREIEFQAKYKNNADAQLALGFMYQFGNDNIAIDYAKAKQWYEKSAEQGNNAALNNLGVLYQNGQGCNQDYAKAMDYYLKSIENGGKGRPQYHIGTLYELQQNYTEAIKWFSIAKNQGDLDAEKKLQELKSQVY